MTLTMLGVEDYGSDNESDDQSAVSPAPLPLLSKNDTLALPPPAASTSKISLPPPKSSKRGPKKIAIGFPSLTDSTESVPDKHGDEPAAKKPRLEAGVGSSSLLSMLPAPKQKNPVAPTPERVLGGRSRPGLVFNTSRSSPSRPSHNNDDTITVPVEALPEITEISNDSSASFSFLPPSLMKGRANVSVEEDGKVKAPARPIAKALPTVDFFSLGSASSTQSTAAKPVVASPPSSATPLLPTVSSAPVVPTFTPPEPSPTDPYPGYYLLPSGSWVAHDPSYYGSFLKKWEKEYNAQLRALEKGAAKGFEEMETAGVSEVDAMRVMEKAKEEIQEREKRKAVTKDAAGAPLAPNMKITAAKQSGLARTRHQLSTMLTEAYTNREALEERIAEGRRNRKEAGNKYGF